MIMGGRTTDCFGKPTNVGMNAYLLEVKRNLEPAYWM